MKRFLILPLLLIGLLFNGCVNDNDDYDPEYLELGVVYGAQSQIFQLKPIQNLLSILLKYYLRATEYQMVKELWLDTQ